MMMVVVVVIVVDDMSFRYVEQNKVCTRFLGVWRSDAPQLPAAVVI
jgi:hypothetical protein